MGSPGCGAGFEGRPTAETVAKTSMPQASIDGATSAGCGQLSGVQWAQRLQGPAPKAITLYIPSRIICLATSKANGVPAFISPTPNIMAADEVSNSVRVY